MQNVTVFSFESAKVRTVSINGQPWFVAADVVRCLGLLGTTGNHYAKLGADEMRKVSRIDLGLPGGKPMVLISESGLYKLIMRSDKPSARRFQDWVTRDVLPALRKDGTHVVGEEKVKTGERRRAGVEGAHVPPAEGSASLRRKSRTPPKDRLHHGPNVVRV